MSKGQEKVIKLNTRARANAENGNTLLATWMRDSAKHFEKIDRDVEKQLDKLEALRECKTNSAEISRRNDFNRQWFSYEEENLMNWDRN